MSRNNFDVIIIGAGPAGCKAAITLAKKNIKVLVLEKYSIPRVKPCAAGLPKHNDKLLDFSIDKVIKCVSDKTIFLFNRKQPVVLASPEVRIKMTMRAEFDALLAEYAINSGAIVKDKSEVLSITEEKNQCIVKTKTDVFSAKYLIGADGPHSITARSANLLTDRELGYAINAEVYVSDKQLAKQEQTVVVDMGCQPRGYIWIFPKDDHLSCGIGINSNKIIGAKEKLLNFLDNYQTTKNYKKIILQGHPLPHSYKKELCINTARIFLAGDAASLVEPLSGEGIYYALKSGELAALYISDLLISPQTKTEITEISYSELINREIRLNLFYADKFAQLFYNHPKLIYKLGVANPIVNSKFEAMLADKLSYKDIYDTLKPLYSNAFVKPIVSIAKKIKKVF